jgi:metallo-beta-lactamase class B
MKEIRLLVLLFALITGCTSTGKDSYNYTSDQLKIKSLGTNIFVHISYLVTNDFGKVECNGMVYLHGDEAIVFDTPTDDKAASELIDWIEVKQGKKIKAVVVTHFHEDCLGSLKQFHDNETMSYALSNTIELARDAGVEVLPISGFDHHIEFTVGGEPIYATYYGAGHTKDNIVGYVPNEQTLFGGCLIKTLNAGKGYLGDAHVQEWPTTVEAIKKNLPQIKRVIPGHGNEGGKELLDYTIELFRK